MFRHSGRGGDVTDGRNPISRIIDLLGAVAGFARFGLRALRDAGRCPEETLYEEFLRWLPGEPGQRLRRAYYTPRFANCGEGLLMLQGIMIQDIEKMRVGSNFAMNAYVMINAAGGLEAGDDVLVGPGTKIWTINHRIDDPGVPVRLQGYVGRPVRIGNDVWIAAQCVILPGVSLGDHSVIGAGSVVTRDVPPWTVVAGNPAKSIRERPRV